MLFFINFFVFISLFFGNFHISKERKNPETGFSAQILSAELPIEEVMFEEQKVDLKILENTQKKSVSITRNQVKVENFSNEKQDQIYNFGNSKSFDFSSWNNANYSGIGLWTDVLDRNYFVIHSHLNPKAKNLSVNEKIIINEKNYKVVSKYEKDNSTDEGYKFVFQDHFFQNQLQTCKDDKIVIIYDLEMI